MTGNLPLENPTASSETAGALSLNADWVAIQRNPSSGSGASRHLLTELIKCLRQRGLRPRLFSRRERLDDWIANPEHRERLRCIVAAGGDGTVRDVISRFPGCRLAILPLGTENLVARYLGIPKSGEAVAAMIAAGHSRRLDLGLHGERRFTVMASAGFDADVIHRAHSRRRGHIQHGSYVQPIWESLRKYDHPELRVWIDDAVEPLMARLVVVVNLPVYALGLQVAISACGDDGLFDVRLFGGGSAFQMWRYLYNVSRGTHEQLSDVRACRARTVRIESDQPVPLQVDGDPAGWTPGEFRIDAEAFEVMVPPPSGG